MSAEFAGTLARRVTILRRADMRDDLGGASGAWIGIATVWVALAPAPPAAWGAGGRPVSAPRWQASLRREADVQPGDRLQWRGIALAVRSVASDPATPDRLTLLLEEDR